MPRVPARPRFTRSRARRGRPKRSTNPSATTTTYHGPLRQSLALSSQRTMTTRMTSAVPVVTNVSGVISIAYDNKISGFSEYANLSSLYDEHRVLSMRVTFMPVYGSSYFNSAGTNQTMIMISSFDRDTGGVYANLPSIYERENAKLYLSSKRTTFSIRMSGTEDSGFQNTQAPVATWYFTTFGQTGAASIAVGWFFFEILVQFRLRV